MIYQVISTLLAGWLVFVAGVVIHTVVTCRLARWRLMKVTKGLPMPDEPSWLCNGTLKWAVRKNINPYLWSRYGEFKEKTLASLYGTMPVAFTLDLDFIKRILAAPDKHLNRMHSLHMPFKELQESIFMARDDDWRRVRRSFAPALKPNRFKTPNVMSEIEHSIEKLIGLIEHKLTSDKSKLTPEGGRLIELDDLASRYSHDLHFSCFYKQPDVINLDERPCHWVELTESGMRNMQESLVIRACLVFPILVPLVEWFIVHFHPQGVWRRGLMDFIKQQTKLAFEARKETRELRESGQKFDPDNFTLKDGTKFKRNMIDYAIDQFHDGKLSLREYLNTSFFLMEAANKTSADPVIFILYQLSIKPQIQQKLRKSIQLDGIESEYLQWVLNEANRLMPPVSSGPARMLGEDMEIEDGKHMLPKGTFVLIPTYVLHRIHELWGEDSEEFKPERWQDTSKHHPLQYLPFGAGPRMCPGGDFAMFQLKHLFVALLTRYKFEAKIKDDFYVFDSPFFFIHLPNSPTYVTVQRLEQVN